jgi:predicted dehydrogenase
VSGRQFGLVGAGLFGEIHARAYASHPAVELAAVCDLDEERAGRIASKYGAGRACGDWREVASDADIGAASVATPDFTHTEIAVGLAEAGKHILVEKPLATTVEECERIIAAARASGVKLMVDFHNRWNPAFHEAHRRVREGELGSPRLVYFRLSNSTFVPMEMLSWAAESSVLWFLGSHAIDMVCWLVGEWPHRVYSVSRREVLKGMGVDTPDLFQTVLEFPGGAVASIENCWLLPRSAPNVFDLKCEIVGSKAAAYVDTSSNRTLEVDAPGGVQYVELLGGPVVHGRESGFMVESIWHFVDCVVEGRDPLVPGEVGLEVTRIAQSVERSAETGEPVEIAR